MVYAGVGIASHYDIFRLSADATIDSNLTLASSYDFWPRWSPDGSQFVFESSRNGVVHTAGGSIGQDIMTVLRVPAVLDDAGTFLLYSV